MPAEPITFFSHKLDPAGVARALRSLAPKLEMVGNDDDWTRIDISESRGLLRKPATIRFNNDPGYYTGAEWEWQRSGMLGYFSQFPLGPLMPKVIATIDSFRFAVATIAEPLIDFDSSDPRLKYVRAVARHLDAAIFTPSALRDAQGRVLAGADGESDPAAVWPQAPVSSAPSTRESEQEEEEEQIDPPSPQRVARRALALAAVAGRALLELPDSGGDESFRPRLIQWVDTVGVRDELEPDEEKLLQQPLGVPSQQEAVNATWRLEGLAVLAWALGRFELPRHDQQVDAGQLMPAICLLDAAGAKGLLADARLRTIEELKAMSDRLLAIHWRLRQFRADGGEPIADWPSEAKNAWFPLNLAGIPLIDGDLALGDAAIADASEDLFQLASSIAQERHQAINWLAGDSAVYSETDTPT
jgi:hypothetical protein